MAPFAALFPGKTIAIPDTAFKQVDPTHWVNTFIIYILCTYFAIPFHSSIFFSLAPRF